jgi:hypothetical protein
MGHLVTPALPDMALSGNYNVITMMRNPWKRIQSDFHYIRSRPHSGHLGPNINLTSVIFSLNSTLDLALYPGIANCATKVYLSVILFIPPLKTFLTDVQWDPMR